MENTSHNSLTSCTPLELLYICRHLQIPLSAVEAKHEQILSLIATGEFQKKYKHKTVYLTLIRWLQMGIDRGYIQKNYDILSQEHRLQFEEREREAIAHGLI